jgi:hypothetical protein
LNFTGKSAILSKIHHQDDKMASKLDIAKLDIDREKVGKKIALISEKLDADIDPRLLNEYRLLFKKGFSFFRRSWAAAYLLMLCDRGLDLGRERGPVRRGSRAFPGGEGEKAPALPPDAAPGPRPFLAEEESRRLFVSIGRNRRVFPREILGLIITRAQVAREDIGMIRILDSYSFVQVRDTVADTIIEALNGTVFRGRPMTVNYARLKREEGREEGQNVDQKEPAEIDEPPPAEGDAADAAADAATSAAADGPDALTDTAERTVMDAAGGFAEETRPGEEYSGASEQGDDQTDKEGV